MTGDNLYRDFILEHYREPHNRGVLEPHDLVARDLLREDAIVVVGLGHRERDHRVRAPGARPALGHRLTEARRLPQSFC